MAAKGLAVVDHSVSERRLRPVYECLDNGNNKKAIQEAEKVLKKQPNFHCAKVLKGLGLLRLGREEECEAILEEVKKDLPAEDTTLQAMSICYKEMHRFQQICEIYEVAVKKDPTNEEFLSHLFMSYVRTGNFKKQQQVAMNLYKLKSKNPYYFWAVMSIVMQAFSSDDSKLAQTVSLPLAERMVEKFIQDGRIEAEAEVEMYLIILELQGKYKEALEVLCSPLADKITSQSQVVRLRRLELLKKLNMWQDLNCFYKVLIKENPHQWSFYEGYFSSLFLVMDMVNGNGNVGVNDVNHHQNECEWNANSNNNNMNAGLGRMGPAAMFDSNPSDAFTFLNDVLAKCIQENMPNCRAPYLARIEFYRQLKARKDFDALGRLGKETYCEDSSYTDSPLDLLINYVRNFGDKPCLYSDLQSYVDLLDKEDVSRFLGEVTLCLEQHDASLTIRDTFRHQNEVMLKRRLGMYEDSSAEELEELVRYLIGFQKKTQNLNQGLLPTDFRCNDYYILLACHMLVDAWKKTGDERHLIRVLILLETEVMDSPANYQYKLLLCQVYNLLGAMEGTLKWFEGLDVKHIMWDTVSHLLTRHVAAQGHFSSAVSVFSSVLKFFTAHNHDSLEYLISAYKFGSFHKIQEFMRFRERVRDSHTFALVVLENMMLDLLLESESHASTAQLCHTLEMDPEDESACAEDLWDNRDFSTMLAWDSSHKDGQETWQEDSYRWEMDLIKLRSITLRCVLAAYQMLEEGSSQVQVPRHQILQRLAASLKTFMDGLKTQDLNQMVPVLIGGFRPRLCVFADRPDLILSIVDAIDCVLCIHNHVFAASSPDSEGGGERNSQHLQLDPCRDLCMRLANSITWVNDRLGDPQFLESLVFRQRAVEELVDLCEVLSVVIVLCDVLIHLLKPYKTSLVKRSKKRKKELCLPPVFGEVESHVKNVKVEVERLLECVGKVEGEVLARDLSEFLADVSLITDNRKPSGATQAVLSKILNSYDTSFKEIRTVLQKKLKYLSSLTL